MRIAGIDLSVRRTGFVIRTLDPRGGIWTPKSLTSAYVEVAEGLMPAVSGTKEFIQSICKRLHKGDQVFIEDYAVVYVGAAIPIIELGGLLKYCVQEVTGKAPLKVVATTLKKFATGSGKGEKSQILKRIYQEYGYDAQHDDEADAFVLSQIGVDLLWETDKEQPKFRQEVLKAVKKYNNLD